MSLYAWSVAICEYVLLMCTFSECDAWPMQYYTVQQSTRCASVCVCVWLAFYKWRCGKASSETHRPHSIICVLDFGICHLSICLSLFLCLFSAHLKLPSESSSNETSCASTYSNTHIQSVIVARTTNQFAFICGIVLWQTIDICIKMRSICQKRPLQFENAQCDNRQSSKIKIKK